VNNDRRKDPGDEVWAVITTKFAKAGEMTRKIRIESDDGGCITVHERDNDDNLIEVDSPSGFNATVALDANRLWNLASVIITELFGGAVLTHDERHATEQTLRDKIHDVLVQHEARCLDDNIDRDAVVAELVKALT
jgi:hypothetical protein